jgi:hypothetical protein
MSRANLTPENLGPGAWLDDLLASRFLPRRPAARIRSASKLPARLANCARNLAADLEWRAYGDGDRTFFAIARLHQAEPASPSGVAIDAYFLDDNASVYCAGVWEYDQQHGWWLDALPDLSYDCDHGWWLDALERPSALIARSSSGDGRREIKLRRAPP